ncbi:hypothetical protein QYF36_024883 [Acer negundo]|nr:hypothetical protein QYF36_024883 [Acer negundo]
MDMKMLFCTLLVVAATMTTVALASRDALALHQHLMLQQPVALPPSCQLLGPWLELHSCHSLRLSTTETTLRQGAS